MRAPDVFFTPVPDRVLAEMFRIAAISGEDTVVDPGCGDGRIVIAAARDFGARGVGIDIDPARIAESRVNAAVAGVEDRVEFIHQDLFESCLSEATVIALYLQDSLNIRLRPKILAECKPGVRVVSYSFEMGEWQADAHTPMAANGVFLWIVPSNISGQWSGDVGNLLAFGQTFQKLTGAARIGGELWQIDKGRVSGECFSATARSVEGHRIASLAGRIHGGVMEAMLAEGRIETPITLKRAPDSKAAIEPVP